MKNYDNTATVLLVETKETIANYGVKVSVLKTLKGQKVQNKEITIWGDPGHLCRDSPNKKVNQRWVASVSKIQYASRLEKVGDFAMGGCAVSKLLLNQNKVEGKVLSTKKDTSLIMDDFIQVLNNPHRYFETKVTCSLTSQYQDYKKDIRLSDKNSIEINPNEANSLEMKYNIPSPQDVDLNLHGEISANIANATPEELVPHFNFKLFHKGQEVKQGKSSTSLSHSFISKKVETGAYVSLYLNCEPTFEKRTQEEK